MKHGRELRSQCLVGGLSLFLFSLQMHTCRSQNKCKSGGKKGNITEETLTFSQSFQHVDAETKAAWAEQVVTMWRFTPSGGSFVNFILQCALELDELLQWSSPFLTLLLFSTLFLHLLHTSYTSFPLSSPTYFTWSNRWSVPSPVSQQAGMADGQQPEEHWASNGQENGENGYSAYSSAYRENGYHGGAAAHPGTTGRNMVMVCRRSFACICVQYWLNDIDCPPS